MKNNNLATTIISLAISAFVALFIFWLFAWLLACFWNNLVIKAFDTLPLMTDLQAVVIVIGVYVTRQIIKWW